MLNNRSRDIGNRFPRIMGASENQPYERLQFVIPTKTLRLIFIPVAVAIMASIGVRSETTAIGHPVVTPGGIVAYQVDKIIRLEGNWKSPIQQGNALLYEGMLLYPTKPVAVRGMERRLGEAIILFFPQPGNPEAWRGCHVHNGFVPAYGGRPATELISEIERTPLVRSEAIIPVADPN